MKDSLENIYVVGGKGTGKTSLVNILSCLGSMNEFVNFIEVESVGKSCVSNDANCICYCLDGSKDITAADTEFINKSDESSLLIITKIDLMSDTQIRELMKQSRKLFPIERIVCLSSDKKTGFFRLVKKICDICAKSKPDSGNIQMMKKHVDSLQKKFQEFEGKEFQVSLRKAVDFAENFIKNPPPLTDPASLILNKIYLINKIAIITGMTLDSNVMLVLIRLAGIQSIEEQTKILNDIPKRIQVQEDNLVECLRVCCEFFRDGQIAFI